MTEIGALVVLPGGGFYYETKCLLSQITQIDKFVYLRTPFGGTPGEDGIPAGQVYEIPEFATYTKPSRLASVKSFVVTLLAALRAIIKSDVGYVVSSGCSSAVPVMLAGRLSGRTCIFVESMARADVLSLSGRLVYHFRLSDCFLVQWPTLAQRYKHALLGSIL